MYEQARLVSAWQRCKREHLSMASCRNLGEWAFWTLLLAPLLNPVQPSFGIFLSFTLISHFPGAWEKLLLYSSDIINPILFFVNHGQINVLKTPKTHMYLFHF